MSKSVFLAFLVLAWNLGAQQDRIVGKIDPQNKVILKGNVNWEAQPQYDQGPVDPKRKIAGMTLVLQKSPAQQADLEKLLADQQDASSPDYHNWLTPQQYADRFGASRRDMAQVTDWLTSEGFSIDYVAQGRNWILFSGAAGQVRKTFDAEIHAYRVDGETHYANPADPSIPAALEPLALALMGLDDFRPTSASHFHPMPSLYPRETNNNGSHNLVPGDIGTIYDIAPLWAKGFDGTGIKIAVVGQYDLDMSDVTLFRSHYGFPNNDPQKVLVPGSSAPDVTCCEAQLDLEYSGAMAPNASLIFVYSTSSSTSAFYAIDQNLAPIISYSYYRCEPKLSNGGATAKANQAEAQKANAQGITWIACTGDSGAAGCDPKTGSLAQNGLAVGSPSTIPEVTAVGGTEFNEGSGHYWNSTNGADHSSALGYIPEMAWNDSHNNSNGVSLVAAGGGTSIYYPKPAWQTGPGVPNDQHRDVPDISFAASASHDGYWIAKNGAMACCEGGTSISTPIFAGVLALLNQYQISIGAQTKPGLGNVNPMLYKLAQTTPGIFNDVTVGSNIVPCEAGSKDCSGGGLGYSAGPGYDQATGLGSADIYRLVTQWNMNPPAGTATTTTVTANPASIAVTGSTNITATVKANTGPATPTGSVSFSTGSTTLGNVNLAGSGGSATASITAAGNQLGAGNNTITASYSGDSGFSASSGSVSVSVGGGSAQSASQLTVVSATSKQVQLSWPAMTGAGSYSVFRLPTVVTTSGIPGSSLQVSTPNPSTATPIATVNGLTYTDNIPDPSATYTYFVGPNSSQLNQVTVGPPPFGFNVVVPSTDDNCETNAILERMELDGNGDPAMAYVVADPNGDGDESDDTLYFVSWNRAKYTWNPPVLVAVTGPGFSEGPTVPLSLARDAATGMWGVAYEKETDDGATIVLATSTDGLSWKSQSISGSPFSGWLCTPSLAMWNGSFYAVFRTENSYFGDNRSPFPTEDGFLYVTGKVTDGPAKWTFQPVLYPPNYTDSFFVVSLALDSNHNPGIAFNVANDNYEGVAFWRPGMASAVLVARSNGDGWTNDHPAISLTFFGVLPRIATDAGLNSSDDPDSDTAVWATGATDSGALWLSPVKVPVDGANEVDSPWITAGSKGQTAIGMASDYDPEGPGMLYGFPKIARSNDLHMAGFQTTAPAPLDQPSFSPNNAHPVLRFGGNDKLWLAFNNNDSNGDIGIGLVLWREQ
jgi:hypothetical protein